MDDIMQEIVDEAVAKAVTKANRERDIKYVRILMRKGYTFEEAVETAEISTTPIDELRGMLLPGD